MNDPSNHHNHGGHGVPAVQERPAPGSVTKFELAYKDADEYLINTPSVEIDGLHQRFAMAGVFKYKLGKQVVDALNGMLKGE